MKGSGASAGKKNLSFAAVKALAVLTVAFGFGMAAGPAQATHAGHGTAAKPENQAAATMAAKDVETTSSIGTNSVSDNACSISRKRLFVEGEGWIVRRVPTCY